MNKEFLEEWTNFGFLYKHICKIHTLVRDDKDLIINLEQYIKEADIVKMLENIDILLKFSDTFENESAILLTLLIKLLQDTMYKNIILADNILMAKDTIVRITTTQKAIYRLKNDIKNNEENVVEVEPIKKMQNIHDYLFEMLNTDINILQSILSGLNNAVLNTRCEETLSNSKLLWNLLLKFEIYENIFNLNSRVSFDLNKLFLEKALIIKFQNLVIEIKKSINCYRKYGKVTGDENYNSKDIIFLKLKTMYLKYENTYTEMAKIYKNDIYAVGKIDDIFEEHKYKSMVIYGLISNNIDKSVDIEQIGNYLLRHADMVNVLYRYVKTGDKRLLLNVKNTFENATGYNPVKLLNVSEVPN